MLPVPFLLSSDQSRKRTLSQVVIPFLKNIIFQDTHPLSFELEHIIHTLSLAREHFDSYLYYFRYKTRNNTITNSFSNYFLTQFKV